MKPDVMKPDIVRSVGGRIYGGESVLELYAEPARSRTVLYGEGPQTRPARIRTPDLFVTCLRASRQCIMGLLRPDPLRPGSLLSTYVPHGDALGFLCVGPIASVMVARGSITPSEAVWMSSFIDALSGCDVEQGIMMARSRWPSIDDLLSALRGEGLRYETP